MALTNKERLEKVIEIEGKFGDLVRELEGLKYELPEGVEIVDASIIQTRKMFANDSIEDFISDYKSFNLLDLDEIKKWIERLI